MIAAVAPVSATAPQETASEVERALGALRVGEVVQAHADAILKDGIARLVVANSALNIRPTIQLVPGTPVSLALKHGADGRLDTAMRRGYDALCHEIHADVISVCREIDATTAAREANGGDRAEK